VTQVLAEVSESKRHIKRSRGGKVMFQSLTLNGGLAQYIQKSCVGSSDLKSMNLCS